MSLDENDNDLRTFTAYFTTAVEILFPGACRITQALLNTPDLPPMAALVTSLLNELDRIEQSFIMVLDDYSLIKETGVHNLLAEILKHPPQSLHLVIVGRRDPSLPISTLRAQSRVTEIRTQDLRFTVAETEMFLNQVLGIQIDPSTAVALEEKTEGWVTGLRLAALSMRHRGNLDPKLLEPQMDAQYVMEYLFKEVFSLQPPEISQYLLGTAILDRFCGPLCEAVCAPGVDPLTCEFGGWNFIAWLKRENVFLIPLDPENRWFRYHHLFQKLLVKQLKRNFSTEEIKTLHAQAFQAELALRQGHLAEASHWAKQFVAKPFLLAYRFYMPQLTLVKILLAQDTTLSRENAADLIKQLYDFFVFTHNTRFQIDVLALQALLYDTRGEGPAALESLAKALDLAQPGGFIRLCVDLGPQMANLLKRLQNQNVAVDYIEKILAAFEEDENRAMQAETDHLTAHSPPLTTQPLVEPLTNRELDALELLAQRLQNKEIAAKIFISPETVKKHLNNIYRKLNVSNRRQAVEKAKALGILSRR